MAKSRLDLQAEFEALLGSRNVYYQPPETKKMDYPCIVYEKSNVHSVYADNRNYRYTKCYSVKYIHLDVDSKVPDDILLHFEMIQEGPTYIADNLYHDTFTLYY